MSINAKIALRSLTRSKGRVFARILSLTLGLALGVYLLSYVNYRYNYDNFLPDHDRIYKIFTNVLREGGGIDQQTYAPLAHSLMHDCPGVECGTRMYGPMTYNWTDENGKEYEMTGYAVDSLFFDVLDFGLLVGDPEMMNDFGSIFISEEMSKRIFGDESPIGKVLNDNMNNPKHVAGIFRTSPYNTSLGKFDVLMSDSARYHEYDYESCWDGTNEYFSYIKLRPGASAKDVEDWMNNGMLKKYGLDEIMEKFQTRFMMVPVKRAEVMVGTRKQYMDFIAVLSILVLVLCALNYALLAISSLVNRSRTIAVMRCTAAEKKDIWAQFMWETVFVMVVASALTVLTICLLRNPLSQTIDSPVADLFNWNNIWITVAVVLVLFFSAGMIPAVLFASVPTTVAFRGISDRKKGWKQGLLVFEIVCVSLASAFLLVSVRQIRMLQEGKLGYNPKDMVYVSMLVPGGDALFNAERDLESLPCVDKAGSAYRLPVFGYMPNVPCIDEKTGEVMFPFAEDQVSYSYFDVMEIKVLEGHVLQEGSSFDDVVVNRQFCEMAGLDEPIGSIICEGNNDGDIVRRLNIVGVVEDVRSTESGRIQPMVYKPIGETIQNADMYFGGFRTFIRMNDMSQKSLDAVSEKVHQYESTDKYRMDIYEDTYNSKMKGEFHFKNLLLIVFVLSMVLAVIGLVGYISDELKRRSKEIALRKVCGAEMPGIIGMMIREFSVLAIPSIIVGELLAVLAARRWLQMFEYRLPLDWWMFALTGVLVLAAIYIIELLLTVRIANANPAESLKTE